MEPISAISTTVGLAKTASELVTKLYDKLKDREAKKQLEEIEDKLRDLKNAASQLEDENRELRERLRFKSDEYEFHTPFYYHGARPDVPLCPKCFAANISAPMGGVGQDCGADRRRCLVCQLVFDIGLEKHFYAS
jgi:hypothetical protein